MKTLKLLSHILLVCVAIIIIISSDCPAFARREKTTIHKLKLRVDSLTAKAENNTPVIPVIQEDTLLAIDHNLDRLISLAGYDKPLTASRETIHATNHFKDSTISSVSLLIVYLDYQNRELHRRQVDLNIDLPAGQTQLISFPTWDLQRSFYYQKSTRPRRAAAPYDVKISLLSICAYSDSTASQILQKSTL